MVCSEQGRGQVHPFLLVNSSLSLAHFIQGWKETITKPFGFYLKNRSFSIKDSPEMPTCSLHFCNIRKYT